MAKINSNVITGGFSAKHTGRIQKLFIEFRLAGKSPNDIIALLKDTKLQVDKSTISGTAVKIYPQSVLDLMEISTHFSGAIIGENYNGTGFLGGTVNLTVSGAEQLQKDEYYNIQLSNLPNGIEADIYAIDNPNNASAFLEFTPIDIPANAPKYITVSNALFVAFPYGKVRSIECTFQNRQHVRYEADELEHIVKEGNPMTSNILGKLTTGPINYYVLPVGQIDEIKVDLLDDGKAILVNRIYS